MRTACRSKSILSSDIVAETCAVAAGVDAVRSDGRFGNVGIHFTLRICGRFNESEVGPRMSDGGHHESEGVDICVLGGQISKPSLGA